MAYAINILNTDNRGSSSIPLDEDYDSLSGTDSDETAQPQAVSLSRTSATGSPHSFTFPHTLQSGRSSLSSTATNTPLPSRSTSPLPQFYPSTSSSGASDTDSEPFSPFLQSGRNPWWREDRRSRWWTLPRRRRKRDGRVVRFMKKWSRRIARHPCFPQQPITIVLTLILLSAFAIFFTLLLMYILNPDKDPLPWRAYCALPSTTSPWDHTDGSHPPIPDQSGIPAPVFPPDNLDSLAPIGLFLGVFSIDSAFERRSLIRTTWVSHHRSRNGAGDGDDGAGTSRTVVRFVMGQPRKDYERRIKLEMEMYNDIVILKGPENMNYGKTHSFYSWASLHAWVPPNYFNTSIPPPNFSYSNHTTSPLQLATHDSPYAWQDRENARPQPWVRPDYVAKCDDDSFVMLAELESRLRLELHNHPKHYSNGTSPAFHAGSKADGSDNSPTVASRAPVPVSGSEASQDPLIYWGYLVTNRLHRFMAGELYALSWSLVDWVAKDPGVKGMTKGAEDKQTAKWMRAHPQASEVRWASERCWIYDHPRSGTVYGHGFLFPSERTRVKQDISLYPTQDTLSTAETTVGGGISTPSAWSHSSVSTFGIRYAPPVPDLTPGQSIEALVEGSEMSKIREGNPVTPDYAWTHREGRKKKYEGKRVGGTTVVHFIKQNMWYLETALALLEGEELSEFEKFQQDEAERAAHPSTPPPAASAVPLRSSSSFQRIPPSHRHS